MRPGRAEPTRGTPDLSRLAGIEKPPAVCQRAEGGRSDLQALDEADDPERDQDNEEGDEDDRDNATWASHSALLVRFN